MQPIRMRFCILARPVAEHAKIRLAQLSAGLSAVMSVQSASH